MKELLDSARLQRMLAVPLALTSTGLLPQGTYRY